MDTSLQTAGPPVAPLWPVKPDEKTNTTWVQAVDTSDRAATLPADKPFVAQAVVARLSGGSFPEFPAEIMPPERTLRPFGVPMLPFDDAGNRIERATDVDETGTELAVSPNDPSIDPVSIEPNTPPSTG